MRHIKPIAIAAAAAGALAAAPAASAETFCVNLSPCAGTAKPTIQDALLAAQGNGAQDLVRIGPKATPYVGSAVYNSPEKVTIRGAGVDQTRLSPDAGAAITMVVLSPGSRVEDLTLNVKDASNSVGLRTDAIAAGVKVRYAGSDPTVIGARLHDGALLEDSTIDLDAGQGINRLGNGNATATVRDTTIEAGSGIGASNTDGVNLSRVRITSPRQPLFLAGPNTLSDVVVRMTGGFADAGLQAVPGASVVAHHLTIVGGASGTAVSAYADNGKTTLITLRNSILSGFSRPFARQGDGAGVANIAVSYSRYSGSVLESGGGALTQGAGTTAAAPRFVDAAAGDLRLRGDSALVDAGDPQNVLSPDVDGVARAVDGDGDGTARPDMGALEYRRQAPVVQVTAPPTLAVGAAGAFSASATDADGDLVTYAWSFGDGATATGASATHAFAAPGPQTVTLTATDSGGATATATATVDVPAPPAPPPAAGDPPVADPPVVIPPADTPAAPSATDRTAPAFTKLSATKKAVRFSLSEPARVSVRVERAKGKRWKKVKSVATAARAAGTRAVSLKKLKLRAGAYRVTVTAVDAAGNRSRPRTLRFRVK
jgi:PKD domain